ncbi:MAG: M56 family metallopeptidase [Desulfobacteraceae bacterium]|jgi:beta-lactamase regulating signal transducer with metallopeptidase domain
MIAQLNDIAQIWWQWMGSMFWQVSLLIIFVTVLDMVIRKWAWPQVRCALWVLVFIKLIITPAWQMPTSIVSLIQSQVENQITFKVEVSEKAEKSPSNLNTPDEVNAPVIIEQASWQNFALLTWFSGIVLFSLMLLRKMYKFRKMHRVDDKTGSPEWFNELIIKTAARLKLRKAPSILFSEDAKSPAVYGVFKPVLLLPDGYLDKLSREQAEHVLIHELCHLKRGDLLVHWFCIVVQLVYWFNPLLIWTRRQMRYICEICCDLSVANILKEKTMSYRKTLLHSARELFAESLEPSLGFLGIFEEPFRLVPRLKWLEKRSWENRRRRQAVTVCTTLFMIISVMPMAGISQTSDNGYDEIFPGQDQEKSESTIRGQILYDILLIEAEKAFLNREFGIVSSPGQEPDENNLGMGFRGFKDGIEIDGESFENLEELAPFMQDDPDVNVLSSPRIISANGSTATVSSGPIPDSSNKPGFQIKISPYDVNKNDFISQDIELEVVEGVPGEDRITTKKISTELMLKDGDTAVIGGIIVDDNSSSEKIVREILMFFTPHILELEQSQEPPTSIDMTVENDIDQKGGLEVDDDVLEPLVTEYIPVDYIKADKIMPDILLTDRGTISINKRTNMIIIKDTASSIAEAKEIVKELDILVKQIMFDVKIVEVSHDFREELSLKGNFREGPHSGLTLDAALALAESEGKAKVLSAPKVFAKEGSVATLRSGSPISSIDNNSSEPVEYPLSLTVAPDKVSSDNVITLSVNVKDSRNQPAEKSIETTLNVKSGKTVVVGSIAKDGESVNETGVSSDSELVILITPKVFPQMGA